MYDFVILTEQRYINPKKTDWYIDQVLLEDNLLIRALENKGVKVLKKDWRDTSFNWNNTKYAIFRTTWDYFNKYNEFISWINETKNKTNFINSTDVILWNIDKHYLQDLKNNGINIASSIFIEKGDDITLEKLFKMTRWDEAVIKPTVSGAALNTYRINENNFSNHELLFKKLVKKESFIFQEFLQNIISEGEISLIMIAGEYTHAVRKIAKKGDFRVQDDHGGKVEIYQANYNEIKFAKNCINQCPSLPAYARVDIVYDNKNQISLSELELIEPELWFRNNPSSAAKLSEELIARAF